MHKSRRLKERPSSFINHNIMTEDETIYIYISQFVCLMIFTITSEHEFLAFGIQLSALGI